ncbi:hypothetical protein [Sphingomonas sp. DC1600-2]|jgi:hypothetical protein|uniref:hypothetical protein n=1 Tax=unclassified Sphingomonas TaxID=196159 RepID=UPI003CE833E2
MSKPPTQREVMQGLRDHLGPNKEAVCRAYVAAEARGLIVRKSITKTAEQYADDLWRDGIHKGWLKP